MASAYSEPSALPETCKDYRYSYGPFVIGVSKRFSLALEALLRNQRRAIDLGALYPVTKWTKDYVLGWPFNNQNLACVHVNIPRTRGDALNCDFVSYVESEGHVVSGFFIVPNNECYVLPESRHSFLFRGLDMISFKT
jgi:hypothetical protein